MEFLMVIHILQESDYPTVMLAIIIPYGTPFLHRFFDTIISFDYPKERIHIFLYNAVSSRPFGGRFFEELISKIEKISIFNHLCRD